MNGHRILVLDSLSRSLITEKLKLTETSSRALIDYWWWPARLKDLIFLNDSERIPLLVTSYYIEAQFQITLNRNRGFRIQLTVGIQRNSKWTEFASHNVRKAEPASLPPSHKRRRQIQPNSPYPFRENLIRNPHPSNRPLNDSASQRSLYSSLPYVRSFRIPRAASLLHSLLQVSRLRHHM